MNYTNFLHFLAPAISLTAFTIGFAAVILPKKMSKGFGVEVSGSALAYVIGLGIRDIFIGGAVLIMYLQSAWYSLSITSLLLSMVAVSDFLVVYKNGNKKTSYVHLAGAVIAAVYAAALYLTT